MKDQHAIDTAWKIWNLIAKLNDLIWDHYENEFIERYIKSEEEKHWEEEIEVDF
jgi:hypothetical protein